jgi:hypothetical protein
MNHSKGSIPLVYAAAGGLMMSACFLAPAPSALSYQMAVIGALLGAGGTFGLYRLGFLRRFACKPWLALISLAAAILFSLSLPIPRDGFPQVSITATGLKNARSMSSEVFVRLVSEPIAGLRDFEGKGWEKRGNVHVSYQNQPSTLTYQGAWSSGAYLNLVRHPYSGIAEVRIGGVVQRFDLFSEKAEDLVVPLPEAKPSSFWKRLVSVAAASLALVLFLVALGEWLARRSLQWAATFAAALLAASGTIWLVKDQSSAGSLEMVAFSAAHEPARVEINAGHGFTDALAVPVKGGIARESTFLAPDPLEWRIGIEGGALRVFRSQDAPSDQPDLPRVFDKGCPIREYGACFYEATSEGPIHMWVEGEGRKRPVMLPDDSSENKRLFLLVERKRGQITVTASRAYLQLFSWNHFSRRVESLRVLDADGKPAAKLVRVVSDGVGTYRFFAQGRAEGEYRVPDMPRADTTSFTAMKVCAVLISISFVLLGVGIVNIFSILRDCCRRGQRLEVSACVLGCLLWLGWGVLAGWPAIVGWDGFSPFIQSEAGQITLWYGIGYPLIIGGFLFLGTGWVITLWSSLATMMLLLGVAALFLQYAPRSLRCLAPIMLLCVLPFTVVPAAMMTHLREAFNGLLLALFAVSSLLVSVRWRARSSVKRIAILGLLTVFGAILVLLRIDNLPTLFVMLAGMAFFTGHFRLKGIAKGIAVTAIIAGCWLAVSPLAERVFMPDRESAAIEKRTYESAALINPLTGMLVYGRGRIPEELLVQISTTLDRVMDVNAAMQQWSPYNIIYWHATASSRATPTPAINAQLRKLYIESLAADPILFLRLRLATFVATLGHPWLAPVEYEKRNGSGYPAFHDHLLSKDLDWKHISELSGFPSSAHPFPSLAQSFLDWSAKVASSVIQLMICIILVCSFRKYPLTATIALGEIARAGIFFLFQPASVFLYLYDLHLLGLLLPLLAFIEQAFRHQPIKQFLYQGK